MWRVRQLGHLEGRRLHRAVQQVQPWAMVGDQHRRQGQLQLQQLWVQVRVHRRHRLQQARLQGLWRGTMDGHLQQPMRRVQQRGVQEHLWS